MTFTAYIQTSDEVIVLGEICADDINDAISRARELAGTNYGAVCVTRADPPVPDDRKVALAENYTKFSGASGLKSFLNPGWRFTNIKSGLQVAEPF